MLLHVEPEPREGVIEQKWECLPPTPGFLNTLTLLLSSYPWSLYSASVGCRASAAMLVICSWEVSTRYIVLKLQGIHVRLSQALFHNTQHWWQLWGWVCSLYSWRHPVQVEVCQLFLFTHCPDLRTFLVTCFVGVSIPPEGTLLLFPWLFVLIIFQLNFCADIVFYAPHGWKTQERKRKKKKSTVSATFQGQQHFVWV